MFRKRMIVGLALLFAACVPVPAEPPAASATVLNTIWTGKSAMKRANLYAIAIITIIFCVVAVARVMQGRCDAKESNL